MVCEEGHKLGAASGAGAGAGAASGAGAGDGDGAVLFSPTALSSFLPRLTLHAS